MLWEGRIRRPEHRVRGTGARRPRPRPLTPVRTAASLVIVLAVAPTIVLTGPFLGVGYGWRCALLLVCGIALWFLSFVDRRPAMRDYVALGIMVLVATLGRLAFIWLPNFKPTAAIVMVSALALGAASGFLMGALSMLVGSVFFGVGSWLPWQMYAFGLGGYLAGLIADHGLVPRVGYRGVRLAALACAVGFYVFAIVGHILDTYALFGTDGWGFGLQQAASMYRSGAPVNAIQGIGNLLATLLIANPLLGKLERASRKLNLADDQT